MERPVNTELPKKFKARRPKLDVEYSETDSDSDSGSDNEMLYVNKDKINKDIETLIKTISTLVKVVKELTVRIDSISPKKLNEDQMLLNDKMKDPSYQNELLINNISAKNPVDNKPKQLDRFYYAGKPS